MSLQGFFQAQSVAVVGASRTKHKVGNEVPMVTYQNGKVVLVNRSDI